MAAAEPLIKLRGRAGRSVPSPGAGGGIGQPPGAADIVTRLKLVMERGSPSDRRVARVVLDDPEFATASAIALLANRAGVSEPTVTRFCRTLGCMGLRDFKLLLAQALVTSGRYLVAIPPTQADADSVPSGIAARACAAIETVCTAVDPATLTLSARAIAAARFVRSYGSGGASSLAATELENRLFRLGVAASSHTDGQMQRMTAAAADAGTMIVAYSSSGHARSVVEAVGIAGSYGARTLAITAPDSPLAAAADMVLPFAIEEAPDVLTPSPCRYALLAMTDMLATVVAQHIGLPAIERMRRIRHHQGLLLANAHRLPLGD